MALRPITEQQFRTRRKDRRMVWVDAVAVLVGLVMLVATVGGVVFVEPEPRPIDWDYSFFEGTIKHKHCAGITGVREGCTQIVDVKATKEGQNVQTIFDPVDWPNVTSVRFTLTWVDDTPVTEGSDQECKSDCGKTYPYTENSTDEFLLVVHSPDGQTHQINGTNDLNTQFGTLTLAFDFLALPEAGTVEAFGEDEAMQMVMGEYTSPEHGALGEWRAEVTLLRAGDQRGTLPIDACDEATEPTGQQVPPEVRETPLPSPYDEPCYTEEHHETLEDGMAKDIVLGSDYESSYDDQGQTWILEMAIRAYDTQVTVG